MDPATTSPWQPEAFPAGQRPVADPAQPRTWATPFDCNGVDKHDVTVPLSHTVGFVAVGAISIVTTLLLRLNGQAVSTGIGLMLVPVILSAVRQNVDGPRLIYRKWWVRHTLRLDTATAVQLVVRTTRKGRTTRGNLVVLGPERGKPVRIALARTRADSSPVRAHLAGWLLRDGVAIGDGVEQWLTTPLTVVHKPVSKWALRFRLATTVLSVAALVGAVILRVFVFNPSPLATSAADCMETAPAGSSSVARTYLTDLNAGYQRWVAVSNTLKHNDLLTVAVLHQQEAADAAFVASVRTIRFPEPIAALASDYVSNIQAYDSTLGAAAQAPWTFNGMRGIIHPLNAERQAEAAQLRKSLGLPAGRCSVLRPL